MRPVVANENRKDQRKREAAKYNVVSDAPFDGGAGGRKGCVSLLECNTKEGDRPLSLP